MPTLRLLRAQEAVDIAPNDIFGKNKMSGSLSKLPDALLRREPDRI
jgi:hypothetical protein